MQIRPEIIANAHAATDLWPASTRERQSVCPKDGFEFEHVMFVPVPDVFEDNSEAAWRAWDAAVEAGVFQRTQP